jgi:redox-sensitive bicupin YhaK (pirin superfamily)
MKKILHKADKRGAANHGWLNSRFSFSFANYFDPEKIHFGALRVINDDIIAPGTGFGTHPHDNMEIISIPLEGGLAHKDSMGNSSVIKAGEIQVMSAGTGIQHSEYNASTTEHGKFLQIWIFPNKKDVTPRYDQLEINPEHIHNQLGQILSPNPNDDGVWIHQNAWFHMAEFSEEKELSYKLKDPQNGVYAFLLEGEANISGEALHKRDALGIWDIDRLEIVAQPESKILLMEVPMSF